MYYNFSDIAVFFLGTALISKIKCDEFYSYFDDKTTQIYMTWGSHFPNLFIVLGKKL